MGRGCPRREAAANRKKVLSLGAPPGVPLATSDSCDPKNAGLVFVAGMNLKVECASGPSWSAVEDLIIPVYVNRGSSHSVASHATCAAVLLLTAWRSQHDAGSPTPTPEYNMANQ